MAKEQPGDGWFRTQGLTMAVALLVTIILGGTLGYMVIERWGAWDAFYMTVITVTTVGYKEVHDLSGLGQAFTVVLLLGGVGAALYTFTLLATTVVEGGCRADFSVGGTRVCSRRSRIISLFAATAALAASSRASFSGSMSLSSSWSATPSVSQAALDARALAVEADASREDVLKRVGIDRARGLIAAVGTDAENVYAVLSARVLRPDLFIVGRAESEDATIKLKRAGANRVISPYQIGAVQMAQTALRPAVVDFVELATSSENMDLAMEEITIAAKSKLAETTLVEADIRQRFGIIVVAIQRRDLGMEFNPNPNIADSFGRHAGRARPARFAQTT